MAAGNHAVEEALLSPRANVLEIWSSDENSARAKIKGGLSGKKITGASREALTKMCGTDKHQGVVARVVMKLFETAGEWLEDSSAKGASRIVLALDEMTDPQNVGSVIRSGCFFGASALLFTKDRSAPITASVAKASSGGVFSLPLVRATNLARELRDLESAAFWRIGLDARADRPLWQVDMKNRDVVLITGSEGSGLRELTRKNCDEIACLPGSGSWDSLNAAVAATLAMYEASRQRAR